MFDTGRCLAFPRQAQMHPLRYLAGLARALAASHGRIFTATHATSIAGGRGGMPARIETRPGGPVVTAQDVVVATNTPINDLLTIHTKQYAYRTYVIAGPIEPGRVARALYWDTADPYHYVRLQGDLLIVGGEDHKTGQDEDRVQDRHTALEEWTRARFPSFGAVTHRWSGQVLEPMDGLAFIGRNPGKDENVWIVTGDSGNGMTHGAIAGMLVRDLVLGLAHPWAKLYDPSRKPLSAAGTFARENLNMAAQYRTWITPGEVHDESEIAPGSGAVMRDGLTKLAVYKDKDGLCHRRSATCPHLGALVGWNAEEGTWDCPAHGSRFDPYGKVINGPANADLGAAKPEQASRL
jgi:Rieske Fe-S protein